MNKLFTTFLVVIAGATLLLGCKKKCDFGQDTNSGEIINSISIYPNSGYMTNSISPNQYLITGSHPLAGRFQMSNDEGVTKSEFNYAKYSILCAPVNVSCFAVFDRNVLIDHIGHKVLYTVKIKECGKCESTRYVENYVAIEAVPDHYELILDIDKTSE